MTVSTSISSKTYAGTGTDVAFPTEFAFFSPQDIEVVERIVATGVETTKTLTTDYTASGGLGADGTVTAVTPPPNTVTWTIRRVLAETQETALPVAGSLPSTAVEQMVDRAVMMIQQGSETLSRVLTFPKTDSNLLDPTIPPSNERASKFLAFDSEGNPIASSGPTGNSSIPVSSFIEGLLDDTGEVEARATLGALGTTSDGSSLTGVDLVGRKSIYIPAAAMRPTVSNGCSFLTEAETSAGSADLQFLEFAAGADEHAQFQFSFPPSWDEGTITFRIFWTSTAIDTGGVSWGMQGVAVGDNEPIGAAYGAAIVVDDANQGAAAELLVSAESGAMTIGGTPSEGDLVFFRIFRDVDDTNDTAEEAARLIGVQMFFTTNSGNDS